MTSVCESVTERIALGTPLDELSEHVAGCERCKRLVDMPGKLSAARHDIDPGLGFAARMTIGARQRIAVRRRRRLAAGLASVTLASVAGVFVVAHTPERDPVAPALPLAATRSVDDTGGAPAATEEDDLKALVQLADTRRSRHLSARWSRIERPLAPYKKLLKGVAQ